MDNNYEQKYKDALERARKVHRNYKNLFPEDSYSEDIEEIFPELSESEDERIRKGIICYVEDMPDTYGFAHGIGKADMLDWLEKQKENPKSADSIPSDCVSDAKCEDKSPKHSDSDGTDIRDTPAYWKGWDDAMKQKEQKHPNGCFTCDEYKKGYEEGRRNGFTAGYNKAMKEVEQKEQKPAESSTNLDEILDDYFANFKVPEHQIIFEDTFRKIATDFYELGRNSKPAGWSEQDKKILDDVSHILIGLNYKQIAKDYKQAVEKLIYARPSWKPSEEQEEPEYYQHFDPDC